VHDDRAVVGVDEPDLDQVGGSGGADDHHETFVEVRIAKWMVERVEDVGVGDAVFAGAGLATISGSTPFNIGCRRRVRNVGCDVTALRLPRLAGVDLHDLGGDRRNRAPIT
jgi:hypothetical protein